MPLPPAISHLISSFRSKSFASSPRRQMYALYTTLSLLDSPIMAPFSTRHTVGSPSQSARLLPSKICAKPVWSLKSIAAGSWNCERTGGVPGWGAAGACANAVTVYAAQSIVPAQREKRRVTCRLWLEPSLNRIIGTSSERNKRSQRSIAKPEVRRLRPRLSTRHTLLSMATEPMAIARVLTGTAKNINVRQWSPTSADIPHEDTLPPWKIVTRVLEGPAGGRRHHRNRYFPLDISCVRRLFSNPETVSDWMEIPGGSGSLQQRLSDVTKNRRKTCSRYDASYSR